MDNIIFGIRPVAEAIEAGKQIEKLYIRKGAEGQLMSELRDLCFRHKVRVQEVPVEKLNRLTRGNHQGVVAQISAIEYVGLADILERVPEDETPLVVIFDGVTDVRNFGAIARSAECAGAHGLITPLKNSAPVNAEAIRSSAGALTAIPVCRVGSIRNTVKLLQTEGFQIVAATEKSRKLLYDADFRKPTALVMGAFGFLYVMPLGMSGHAVIPPNKNTFKEIIALSLPDDKGVPYLPCGIRIRSPGFTGPGLADSISSRVEPNFFATVQSDSSPSRITIRDGRSVSSAVSRSSSSI